MMNDAKRLLGPMVALATLCLTQASACRDDSNPIRCRLTRAHRRLICQGYRISGCNVVSFNGEYYRNGKGVYELDGQSEHNLRLIITRPSVALLQSGQPTGRKEAGSDVLDWKM